ncbi:hypothetical protein ACFOOL_00870 [Devosia honganensis]|uniref:Uncharacterized protein n=1 Tax=Devosia honganensis TaxID=1610527 RepID=A0ABV7WVP3_9HYPH
MRILVVIIASVFFPLLAHGQAPLSLSSRLESGWTSNAPERPGGSADTYLRQIHDLSLRGTLGITAIGLGLSLEQIRFTGQHAEDDFAVTGAIEASTAPADGVQLRLGYAQTRRWSGETADLGGVVFGIRNPVTEHETIAELTLEGAGMRLVMGVDGLWRMPGLATVAGLPLPPRRIEPETALATLRADGEMALGTDLAGLARLRGFYTHVPAADRFNYWREPASALRGAAGLRLRLDRFTAQVHAGLDLVRPQSAPHLLRALPHFEASAEAAVLERLTLRGSAVTGLELLDPIDGVAGRTMEAELGARLALTEPLSLSATAAVSRERGLYDRTLGQFSRSVRLGAAYALAPGVELEMTAGQEHVEGPGGPYSVRKLAATLAGRL